MKKYFVTLSLLFASLSMLAQGKFFGGDNDGYASASMSFVVLPVTGMELTGAVCGKNICLHWKTQQEQNTDRFEVERSTGGPFVYSGQVAAAGNSSSPRDYSFTDLHPANGNNLYRLKQLDIDGKAVYSSTITVKFTAERLIRQVSNPAKQALLIRLNSTSQPVLCSIYDINGRLVLRSTYTRTSIIVDIRLLAAGLYVLQVDAGGQTDREKFIAVE